MNATETLNYSTCRIINYKDKNECNLINISNVWPVSHVTVGGGSAVTLTAVTVCKIYIGSIPLRVNRRTRLTHTPKIIINAMIFF